MTGSRRRDDRTTDHRGIPSAPGAAFHCPNCSAPLEGRTCKLRCTRCGYFESCSDLEPAPPRRSR